MFLVPVVVISLIGGYFLLKGERGGITAPAAANPRQKTTRKDAGAKKTYAGKRALYLSPQSGQDREFKARGYEITMAGLGKELLDYLKRIDKEGWSLSEDGYENSGILLALSDSPVVSAKDGKKLSGLNKEGYMIRADEKSIQLVGNSLLALQHAMFDFLERLGCRFLTPSEAWTIIPSKTGLKFAAGKILEQPDFVSRSSFFSTGDGAGWGHDGSLKKIASDCVEWDRATRQGGYANLAFGHTWHSFITAHQEEFRAHPEYFRMNKEGKRESFDNPNVRHHPAAMHFCPSNPGLKALCAADRIALLERKREKNPAEHLVSMDPNDGGRPCLCENCKALGNPTDRALHLANHVAREIRKVHPEAVVGILIYPPHNAPPLREKIEPNIYPMLCTAFNSSGLSYNQLVQGWLAAGARQMLLYDYNGIVQWCRAMPRASRVTFKYASEMFPYFKKKWKAVGAMLETSSSWGRMGPAMYLTRKLLWDVDADADAIYGGYFRDAFGEGAREMRALFDLWENDSSARLTDTNIARWLRQANAAVRATGGETPVVKRRIDDILAYLHFVTLYHESRKAVESKDEARVKETMEELLTFNWRIRNRQVVHTWGFMLRSMECLNPFFGNSWEWRSSKNATAPEYEQYWKWNPHNTSRGTALWQKNTADYSSKEIHRIFKKDLAVFSAKIAQNKQFSKELVPLFEGPAEPFVPFGYYTKKDALYGPTKPSIWHIYIDKLTPLRITFNTSRHWSSHSEHGHIQKAILTNSKGKVLFSQQVHPYEKGKAQLAEINVKLGPGLYRLELGDGNSNISYRPIFEPQVKHVYEQSAEHSVHIQYFVPGYFYVPKGTKEVRLTYRTFLTIKAPSWEKAKSHNEKTQGLLVIPVGEDDGKIWEIRHVTASQFEFLNIPPYVATSRGNMLVPEEVLRKDGSPGKELGVVP